MSKAPECCTGNAPKFLCSLLLLGLVLTTWWLHLFWGIGRPGDSEILLRKLVLDSIKPEEREVSQPLKCKWARAGHRLEAIKSSMQEVARRSDQVLFEAHKSEYIQKLKDSTLEHSP